MESNDRPGSSGEFLNQILIGMHQVNGRLEKLETGQKEMIGAFNRSGDAILGKLDELTGEMKGMRNEMKTVHDHEARLRKPEEIVLRKGA